jgi:hypothetical protein
MLDSHGAGATAQPRPFQLLIIEKLRSPVPAKCTVERLS